MEKNLTTWSDIDKCLSRINIIFNEFKRERVLNDYEQELKECEQKLHNIEDFLNDTTRENYIKMLNELINEYKQFNKETQVKPQFVESFVKYRVKQPSSTNSDLTESVESDKQLNLEQEEEQLKQQEERNECSEPTCFNYNRSLNESLTSEMITSTPRGRLSSLLKADKSNDNIQDTKQLHKELRFSNIQNSTDNLIIEYEDDDDRSSQTKLKIHQDSRDSGINIFGNTTSENPSYQSSSVCLSSEYQDQEDNEKKETEAEEEEDEEEVQKIENTHDKNEVIKPQIELRQRQRNKQLNDKHIVNSQQKENSLLKSLKFFAKIVFLLIILFILITILIFLFPNLRFNDTFGILLFNQNTLSDVPTPY